MTKLSIWQSDWTKQPMETDIFIDNEYINYAEIEKSFQLLHKELELGH
jgi:hypothetical protein